MNRVRLVASLSAVLVVTPLVAALPAAAPSAKLSADALVREALEAEVAGDAAERARLLAAAVAADPGNSAARWQSGQVQVNGHWLPLADVESVAAADPRHADYRGLRNSLSDAIDDHRDLARWCDNQGLAGEARFHWESVLRSDLADAESRARLNLVAYRGDLYTPEQIVADKVQRKQFAKDRERFTAVFRQTLREAASDDSVRRAAALASIREFDNPAAIPALENVATIDALSPKGPLARIPAEKRERIVVDVNLAVVDALARMIEPESTIDLANYAVLAPWSAVRKRAAESLKSRKPEEYVPLMIGAMRAPMESQVDMTAMPDGTVGLMETITEHGFSGDAVRVRDTNFGTAGAINMDLRRCNPSLVLAGHLQAASNLVAATEANVEAANERAERLNHRIQAALSIALDKNLGPDVQAWWKSWRETNELSFLETSPAVEKTYEFYDTVYEYPQLPPPMEQFDLAPERQGTEGTEGASLTVTSRPTTGGTGGYECFVAGTVVWTQTGAMQIERLAIGDLVLSQNPTTGELAYKPIVRTTVGTPDRLLRLEFPRETITTTRGHRFWVDGAGWEMAKELPSSAILHSVYGPIDLAQSEEVPKEELEDAYNLVVQDFGTYFVGESRLLVHDVTCPRPTRTLAPGLMPQERNRARSVDKGMLTSTVAPTR